MTILAYVGRPGHGKSYGVVENVILPSVKKGRAVWTNIPLVIQEWETVWPDHKIKLFSSSEAEEPGFWASIPGGAVIVIDECWRFWPPGKASDLPQDQKSFFSEHRHKVGGDGYTQEIVLIVQDLTNILTFVRNLIDKTFVATKLDAVGADRRYRVDIYQGPQKGPNYREKDAIRQIFGTYKPEIFALYKSHTKAVDNLVGVEDKPDKRGNIFGGLFFRVVIPGALVVGVAGVWSVVSFFKGPKVEENKVVYSVTSTGAVVPALPSPTPGTATPEGSPAPTPAPPALSTRWRLVGSSVVDGQLRVYLQGKHGKFRVILASACRDLDFEPVCEVDHEIVARWTGPESSGIHPVLAGAIETVSK